MALSICCCLDADEMETSPGRWMVEVKVFCTEEEQVVLYRYWRECR
jgi:hypothetical protein